jgi:hypothetical protein
LRSLSRPSQPIWPGFGYQSKPFVDWRPQIYEAFLAHLLTRVEYNPLATIAAGPAAGYVMKHAARHAGAAGRLVLLSPTWRGPRPTLSGGNRPFFSKIALAFDLPVIGPLLYRLNVSRFMITMMGAAMSMRMPNGLWETAWTRSFISCEHQAPVMPRRVS